MANQVTITQSNDGRVWNAVVGATAYDLSGAAAAAQTAAESYTDSAIGARALRFDQAQTLTSGQQTQAQDNLGLPGLLSGYVPQAAITDNGDLADKLSLSGGAKYVAKGKPTVWCDFTAMTAGGDGGPSVAQTGQAASNHYGRQGASALPLLSPGVGMTDAAVYAGNPSFLSSGSYSQYLLGDGGALSGLRAGLRFTLGTAGSPLPGGGNASTTLEAVTIATFGGLIVNGGGTIPRSPCHLSVSENQVELKVYDSAGNGSVLATWVKSTPVDGSIHTVEAIVELAANQARVTFDGAGLSGANLGTAWQPSHTYAVGTQVVNGGNFYTCTTAGTSAASGGPTGTGTGISDGTAVWSYLTTLPTADSSGSVITHPLIRTDTGTTYYSTPETFENLVQTDVKPLITHAWCDTVLTDPGTPSPSRLDVAKLVAPVAALASVRAGVSLYKPVPRTTAADGNTTSGSATISSASANFTTADVGKLITGAGVPAGTSILSVTDTSHATMSANASATATTTVFTIGAGILMPSAYTKVDPNWSLTAVTPASGNMLIRAEIEVYAVTAATVLCAIIDDNGVTYDATYLCEGLTAGQKLHLGAMFNILGVVNPGTTHTFWLQHRCITGTAFLLADNAGRAAKLYNIPVP